MMQIPAHTADIFDVLSKGQFISGNSADRKVNHLYKVMEEEEAFEILYDYFRHINFILEKGNDYFYFSRTENKTDLERKIEAALKWIDILDFLKTYDNTFGVGYRFTPSDILVRIKTDAELETKLEAIKRYTGKDKYNEVIERMISLLVNDTFIEEENEIMHQYKVLASFKYLEQLILTIHIPDEVRHEIPE